MNDLSLYSKYAFRDLIRSYSKILSIIITLLISLFILSAILTIEESLENELNENSRVLLGGDLEIDYSNKEGDKGLISQVESFSTVKFLVLVFSMSNNFEIVSLSNPCFLISTSSSLLILVFILTSLSFVKLASTIGEAI